MFTSVASHMGIELLKLGVDIISWRDLETPNGVFKRLGANWIMGFRNLDGRTLGNDVDARVTGRLKKRDWAAARWSSRMLGARSTS